MIAKPLCFHVEIQEHGDRHRPPKVTKPRWQISKDHYNGPKHAVYVQQGREKSIVKMYAKLESKAEFDGKK